MKTLPNINKSVPELTDPAQIQVVSDALEALDTALGAKPSTLTTTAKTIVPAINELQAKSGSRMQTATSNQPLLPQLLTLPSGSDYYMRIGVHADLPASNYNYGMVRIYRFGAETLVELLPYRTDLRAMRNFYTGGSWVGWGEH